MARKGFFTERTVPQIRDLNTRRVHTQRGLVSRVDDLDPASDGLIIYNQLTPGRFFQGGVDSATASRRNLRKGRYIPLYQPRNLVEALKDPRIPLQFRQESINAAFKGVREEEIQAVGFSFVPIRGKDLKQRQVPFYIGPEGVRIFTYSENAGEHPGVVGENAGIEIVPYADARRIAREGGKVTVRVPSRSRKQGKYEMKFTNFPLDSTTDRFHNPRAEIWGLNRDYVVWPKDAFWRFGYTDGEAWEASDKEQFIPQDVAAYVAVAGRELTQNRNWTPLEMNPFALPSAKQAEFYTKLRNNILMFDPSIDRKDHLRRPHLDEISMLLARQAAVKGHDETMFWDWNRDGKLRDYDWQAESE